MASLSCRFYANEFPDVEDTVMVKVQKIADMGAYVTLSEYDNKGLHFYSIQIVKNFRGNDSFVRIVPKAHSFREQID